MSNKIKYFIAEYESPEDWYNKIGELPEPPPAVLCNLHINL